MALRWAYRAVDSAGKGVKGAEEAADATQLAVTLERRGLVLVKAEPDAAPSSRPGVTLGFRQAADLLEITRALAALLPAGLPLARALGAAGQLVEGQTRDALDAVKRGVERGESLADALARHPGLFSPLYVGVVRAGERSGDLDGAFLRLSTQLERDEKLKSRLLTASVYPMILLVLGGAAVLVLMLFVIPRFADLLQGAGARLPASTAALLVVATAFRQGWPFLVVAAVSAAAIALWFARTPGGRTTVARLALALPVIRTVRRDQLAARSARLLSVLLSGGAPVLTALDDAAATVGDPIAGAELSRIKARVREGASLNAALGESALYPPLLRQLVGVGEESGRLGEFLTKSADIFDDRTDRAVQRAVALVEPAMIVGFGVVVGFVALSLFQAIYSVNAGSFH
jgi:type II secretory pathway component PulF